MKSQQHTNKSIKKSKKHLQNFQVKSLVNINDVGKVTALKKLEQNDNANFIDVCYSNGFNSDNKIEILVNQNEINSFIKTERKNQIDKISEKFHSFFKQNFKLKITVLMIFFILFVMICCSLVFVHLLKQELNIVKLKVDKIENSNNDPAVIKVNNMCLFFLS